MMTCLPSTTMMSMYKPGEVVSERIRPNQKLVVTRYADNMYYCKADEHSRGKELVYLERELMPIRIFQERKLRVA